MPPSPDVSTYHSGIGCGAPSSLLATRAGLLAHVGGIWLGVDTFLLGYAIGLPSSPALLQPPRVPSHVVATLFFSFHTGRGPPGATQYQALATDCRGAQMPGAVNLALNPAAGDRSVAPVGPPRSPCCPPPQAAAGDGNWVENPLNTRSRYWSKELFCGPGGRWVENPLNTPRAAAPPRAPPR